MILTEIIDLTNKQQNMTVAYSEKNQQNKFKNRKLTHNAGMYSYGHINPKDSHEFLKKTKMMDLDEDGYYHYIQAIAPIMKSNPFVPRVYQVTVTKDINGQQIPSYRMEALKPGSAVSLEQIEMAINSIDPKLLEMCDEIKNEYIRAKRPYTQTEMCESIAGILDDALGGYDDVKINNHKINQVLHIIRKVLEKNPNLQSDLHGGNIMFRLTSFGVQLVISDPIA